MTTHERLITDRFPRASAYNPEWLIAGASGAANPLWLTEWLAEALDLRPGMRVLDLGCGRASSSVFLRREFGVQVWATDLWFSVSENLRRIRDAGVEDGVVPIHADARSLPFATGFFDAIVCIDSFIYYGTDDLYLNKGPILGGLSPGWSGVTLPAMPNTFDPYREALVVETNTNWPDDLADAPRGEAERRRIAEQLHAEPAQAAELEYIRLHTGFIRQITVTPADFERLRTAPRAT